MFAWATKYSIEEESFIGHYYCLPGKRGWCTVAEYWQGTKRDPEVNFKEEKIRKSQL